MKQILEIAARAYERKAALGGGFRGRAIITELATGAKRTIETGIHAQQYEAFSALFDLIERETAGATLTVGHYRGDRFRKNYQAWI